MLSGVTAFAPKSGFDSFQNVVDMGSVIPIIYCKRHDKER